MPSLTMLTVTGRLIEVAEMEQLQPEQAARRARNAFPAGI